MQHAGLSSPCRPSLGAYVSHSRCPSYRRTKGCDGWCCSLRSLGFPNSPLPLKILDPPPIIPLTPFDWPVSATVLSAADIMDRQRHARQEVRQCSAGHWLASPRLALPAQLTSLTHCVHHSEDVRTGGWVAGLLQMLVLFAGVCLSERQRGGDERSHRIPLKLVSAVSWHTLPPATQ